MDLISVAIIAVVPSLCLGLVFYFLIKRYVDHEQSKMRFQFKQESRKTILPLRLQAYERLVILLERIRVNNLAMRLTKPGMNAQYLQREMVNAIRTEFDHNQSQQLYISENAWKLVQTAREQTVSLMQVVSGEVKNDESAQLFTQVINKMAGRSDYNAIDSAISYLRKEMNSL